MASHTPHPESGVPVPSPWLRGAAYALSAATLGLLFFGAQVKSHEAGLAVPDWPLTFGQNPITYPVSNWVGGIFHEHFHRLYAGCIAALTVGLAVWLAFSKQPRWTKALGGVAVFAVLSQAMLGGLTVWYQLPAVVSSAHGTLAQTFFLITLCIAYALSGERRTRIAAAAESWPERRTPMATLSLVLIGLVYGQLMLGAATRHTESALAIPDFPTTAGNVLPWVDANAVAWANDWRFEHGDAMGRALPTVAQEQMLVHLAHRLGGFLVAGAVFAATWYARRLPLAGRTHATLWALCAIVCVQIALGVLTVWTGRLPIMASLHLVTGAMLLGTTALLALRAWPVHAHATGTMPHLAPTPDYADDRRALPA